jgi:molybdopterin molybdotransferase
MSKFDSTANRGNNRHRMLSLEEAIERSLTAAPRLGSESIQVVNAEGRFANVDVAAGVSLPGFDNSSMDGYAVRSFDLRDASAGTTVKLTCTGMIPAGTVPTETIVEGTCMRIFTGSPLPPDSDAVIMQEDCRTTSDSENTIFCNDSVKPWENVRLKGEDICNGSPVLASGTRITAGAIGLLAATGNNQIEVGCRPRIGFVATGSELAEPPGKLKSGEIFESNRAMLASMAKKSNARPTLYPIVPDSLDSTVTALERAFAENDAVITSGGVSVGDHDHVKPAIEQLGGSLNFWRVDVKPGKPFVLGQIDGKPLFGLPGNPVSALVTFLLMVRPALLAMQGAGKLCLAKRPGRLAEVLANGGDRRHFVRVTIDDEGLVTGTAGQGSHMLGSLARANGLLDMPPKSRLAKGSKVGVILIDQ